MKKDYTSRIQKATDFEELNIIIEQARFDKELADDEYYEIYNEAIEQARAWKSRERG